MKNRIIAFGYEIRDGKLTISNTEAEYVRRIFEKRANGEIYSDIAVWLNNREIPYFENIGWDKHKIKRVLDNQRYLGKDGYPAIICEQEYRAAAEFEYRKPKQTECPPEIRDLKPKMFCADCGTKLHRLYERKRTSGPISWVCPSCKIKHIIQDDELLNVILAITRKVKKELSEEKAENSFYIPPDTAEVKIAENRITSLLGRPDIDLEIGSKLIMEWAALKYDAMKNDVQDHAEKLKKLLGEETLESYPTELMDKIIQKVLIVPSNKISVRYITGNEYTLGKENMNGDISCECDIDTC